VDVEAEIRDLKLRMERLEAHVRSGEPSIVTSMQADITAGVMEIRADVVDLRTEMGQEFGALGIEISGIRSQSMDQYATARVEMLQRFDTLRCEMMELGLRLDRLLNTDGL
jgi:hypothetical protein